MVTVEQTATLVQLVEEGLRYPPPDLSPDREGGRPVDKVEEGIVMGEAVLDLDSLEETQVSGFSFCSFIHMKFGSLKKSCGWSA